MTPAERTALVRRAAEAGAFVEPWPRPRRSSAPRSLPLDQPIMCRAFWLAIFNSVRR